MMSALRLNTYIRFKKAENRYGETEDRIERVLSTGSFVG